LDRDGVIVLGSQAILGVYQEDELPPEATRSMEVDILARGASQEETAQNADRLTGAAGELSPFDATHGFHLDGVDDLTAALPRGWESRLVEASNPATYDVALRRQFTGWCLDPHDLCAAKLIAFREKDQRFVRALVESGLVDADLVATRLQDMPQAHGDQAATATPWLRSIPSRGA
jgi:hypothetical protein